jgi:hypothetical protein
MFDTFRIRPIGDQEGLDTYMRDMETRVGVESAAMDCLHALEDRVGSTDAKTLSESQLAYLAFSHFFDGLFMGKLRDVWRADTYAVTRSLPRAFRLLGEPALATTVEELVRRFRRGRMSRHYERKWRQELRPFVQHAPQLMTAMETCAIDSGVLIIPSHSQTGPVEITRFETMPSVH